MTSVPTSEDRTNRTTHLTPARRKLNDPAQPSLSNVRPSSQQRQHLAQPSSSNVGPSFSQRRRSSPALFNNTPTTPPQFDSPLPSPTPESPPPSPVPGCPPLPPANGDNPVCDLSTYVNLIVLDRVPSNFIPTIHQDRASGPQDRWYYIIKGRCQGSRTG